MLSRIKKDDLVKVITGKDRGRTGTVLKVDRKGDRVLVKGIAIVTKHKKQRRHGEKGQIVKEESYIAMWKVRPVCPACGKDCRVRVVVGEDGKRRRACNRCGNTF